MPQQDTILLPLNHSPQHDTADSISLQAADTLLADSSQGPQPVVSVLKHSQQVARQFKSGDLPAGNNDWVTIHLLLIMALLGWVKIAGGRRFGQLVKSFIAQRNMNIMMREGNIFTERIAVGLFLIHMVVVSLICYLLLIRLAPAESFTFQGFRLFAVVFLVVLVLKLFKNLLVTMVGVIFRNQVILAEYIPMNFIFDTALALFLIPFVILSVYLPSETALYAGVAMWLIVFIYRLFRQFLVSLEYTKFSYVNRFLYLCTFEIAPLMVLIKLILNQLA